MYQINYYLKNKLIRSEKIKDEELDKFLKYYSYYGASILKNKNNYLIKEDDWNTVEIVKGERSETAAMADLLN